MTTWVCLVFLVAVALYMMFDVRNPTWYYSLIAGAVILVGTNLGYAVCRRRVARHGLPDVSARP